MSSTITLPRLLTLRLCWSVFCSFLGIPRIITKGEGFEATLRSTQELSSDKDKEKVFGMGREAPCNLDCSPFLYGGGLSGTTSTAESAKAFFSCLKAGVGKKVSIEPNLNEKAHPILRRGPLQEKRKIPQSQPFITSP
ncbi:hypothetical protein ACH5RR_001278 [Cinchona calisaya]|uniref:Uncharacterized protein n=1 Tax=Cinchona calisaya TaxID=153742 RepID=A0ABD3B448_9GENT